MTEFLQYIKSKYIPIRQTPPNNKNIGVSNDASRNLKQAENDLRKSIDNISTDWKEFADILSQTTIKAASGIDYLYNSSDKFAEKLKGLLNNVTLFDRSFMSLRNTLKLSVKNINEVGLSLYNLSNDIDGNINSLNQYRQHVEKILPYTSKLFLKTYKDINGKTLNVGEDFLRQSVAAQSYLKNNLQLQDSQVASIESFAAATGQSLGSLILNTRDFAEQFENIAHPEQLVTDILTEMGNTSAGIRANFAKMPSQFGAAVIKAKLLGTTVSDMYKSSQEFLDFEKSAASEIKMRVATGIRLVDEYGRSLTDQMRGYALMGDVNKTLEVQQKILEKSRDVWKNGNTFQRKAIAETMNMTEDQVGTMYEQLSVREQLQKSLGKEADEANKLMTAMTKMGDSDFAKFAKSLNIGPDLVNKIQAIKDKDTQQAAKDRLAQNVQEIRDKLVGKNLNIIGVDTNQQDINKIIGKSKKIMGLSSDIQAGTPSNGQVNPIAMEKGNARSKKEIISAIEHDFTNSIYNTNLPGSITGPLIQLLNETTKTINEKLGPTIHDGIVQFHPNDKLTTVVASPFGSMNENIASKISQPVAGINSQTINANAIASAIQNALKGMSINVNVDPMAIQKSIEFNSNYMNNINIG